MTLNQTLESRSSHSQPWQQSSSARALVVLLCLVALKVLPSRACGVGGAVAIVVFVVAVLAVAATQVLNMENLGNRPNTVSGSTVSNTKLSEFFGAHWVPGSELSEFLSAYYLCDKANSPSFFSQNSPSLPPSSVRLSEFSSPKQYSRNSIPPVSKNHSLESVGSLIGKVISCGSLVSGFVDTHCQIAMFAVVFFILQVLLPYAIWS